MSRPFIAALALCALGACSSHKPEETTVATTPPPPQKTVFDPQLKALQKAKDVQKTVDDAAAAQSKSIDDNGG
jgi:hypothetical protein